MLNIISLIPFLVITFYVKDIILQLLLIFFFCASAYHHYALKVSSFIMDCISQVCLIIYFMYKAHHVPVIPIVLLLFILLLLKAKNYDWNTTAYCAWIMGIMYAILLVCIYDLLNIYSWICILIIILLFLIGNSYPFAYKYMWPLLHICGAILLLSIVYNLKNNVAQ